MNAAGSGAEKVYRPRFWVSCTVVLDLVRIVGGAVERGADGNEETYLSYDLTLFSNGDIDVGCQAAIGSASSGSSSKYYPVATKGATSGYCGAAGDFPPVGIEAGSWSFGLNSGPSVKYDDSDNPLGLNGYFHAFTEKECSALLFNEAGAWKEATLSDVF